MKKPKHFSKPSSKPFSSHSHTRASSSSSSAAEPNHPRDHPASAVAVDPSSPSNPPKTPTAATAAAAASSSPPRLLLHHHPSLSAAAAPYAATTPPRPPFLSVAALAAAAASIPPPPPYGLENLERRAVALSDGTLRAYFALRPDPPPLAAAAAAAADHDRAFPRLALPAAVDDHHLRDPRLNFAAAAAADHVRDPPLPYPHHLLPRPYDDHLVDRPPLYPRLPLPYNNRSATLGPADAAAPPGPSPPRPAPPAPPKRKREDVIDVLRWAKSNGTIGDQAEPSGRQGDMEERRSSKQAKTDVAEVDPKEVKDAFLRISKVINETSSHKSKYRSNGKMGPLRCTVCGSSSREFTDLHSLLNHAYNTKNADLRIDHLGLHKALCVLMGWNYSINPVHKKAYQNLSAADAEANREDLILWPPTVVVQNTYKAKKDGNKDGMGNKEMEIKLKEMGFTGGKGKALYGKDGHRGVTLVKFAGSQDGLKEAERLVEFFEKEGHGREGWARARDTPAVDDGSNSMLIKVDEETGEQTWVFYGYLATASDLDMVDTDTKKRVEIKSRREFDLSD